MSECSYKQDLWVYRELRSCHKNIQFLHGGSHSNSSGFVSTRCSRKYCFLFYKGISQYPKLAVYFGNCRLFGRPPVLWRAENGMGWGERIRNNTPFGPLKRTANLSLLQNTKNSLNRSEKKRSEGNSDGQFLPDRGPTKQAAKQRGDIVEQRGKDQRLF